MHRIETNIYQELMEEDDANLAERLIRAFLITDMQSRKTNITTSGNGGLFWLCDNSNRIWYISFCFSSPNFCTSFYTGATAVCALLLVQPDGSKTLHVANVGDSRAVLCCERYEGEAPGELLTRFKIMLNLASFSTRAFTMFPWMMRVYSNVS